LCETSDAETSRELSTVERIAELVEVSNVQKGAFHCSTCCNPGL
jgi:hypothetical protein